MNKMVVTIALVVVGLLLIGAVFYAQRKSGNGKEEISSEEVSKPRVDISDDKFNYEVSCSAPKAAQVYVQEADFIGDSGTLNATFGNRYHYAGMGTGLNPIANDGNIKYHLPKIIETIWVSFVDKKCYSLSVLLPYKKIVSIFEQYGMDGLDLCFLPEGRVLLFLKGNGNLILMDDMPNGAEFNDDEVLSQIYRCYGVHDMKAYYDYIYQKATEIQAPWISYMTKNGSPAKLLDRYLQRFDYKVIFEFEDDMISNINFSSKFTNAEQCDFPSKLGDYIKMKSRLKEIKAMWDTKEFRYTSWMYFNEEEVLRIFDEAYGEDRMQQGELRIKVGADCKSYDLSLNVGGKSFKLEKTEIRVFQDPIDNPNGDGTLIYKNYEGNHRNFFIDDKEYFQELLNF